MIRALSAITALESALEIHTHSGSSCVNVCKGFPYYNSNSRKSTQDAINQTDRHLLLGVFMGSNWLVLLKYLEIESFLTIEILQNHRHQISLGNNFLAILVKAAVRS